MDKTITTVIVFTHSVIDNDSRIQNQVNQLAKKFTVYLCCRNSNSNRLNEVLDKNVIPIPYEGYPVFGRVHSTILNRTMSKHNFIEKIVEKVLNKYLLINTNSCYLNYIGYAEVMKQQLLEELEERNDLNKSIAIIANDIYILPHAYSLYLKLNKQYEKVRLIGDMHELHFASYNHEDDFKRELRKWILNNFIDKCDLITSVSEECVDLYKEKFNLSNTMSIMNVAKYAEIPIQIKNTEEIKLVHTGGASPERKLENMIDLMELLPKNYKLYFYLITSHSSSSLQYLEFLKNRIIQKDLSGRVFILDPIPSETVVLEMSKYDIGIYHIKPECPNHEYAMPNKLFQFIQARLGVVVTPLKSMKRIVEDYNVGCVSKDFEVTSFAESVKMVANNLEHYRINSNKAAHELNVDREWEKLSKKILDL
ncbi:glycosyltransferase [Oceanirhabdus seepicola]|uniref:Glycosyltransferase n=1 Tax=Oceanirhabdus seepicola TaxID=2828781 RepID=A0A9J6NXW4_9CLOT|nr:glycosyltransferase [Oceanirhabdus seepicola]MCM1988737.1 glycosyltransferase [Oceanirhabdus seepicola]